MASGRPEILIVDDNAETRAFLRKHLGPGYSIEEASSGADGWASIQSAPPDLLLADAGMSPPDGRMLCRRVKEDSTVPSLPVILLLSPDEPVRSEPASRPPRPDETLYKPFDIGALHRCVARFVGAGSEADGSFEARLIRIIEDNLDAPGFTARRLADALSMSRRHLTRRVKDEVGKTPASLIRERRIERAKRRLRASPDTIAGVAKDVGYRSASHFSQVFRKQVGRPPSAYRDEHS